MGRVPRTTRGGRRPAPLPAHLRHLLPLLHNRGRIEGLVDALLGLLDALDGDPDREDGEGDRCCADDAPHRRGMTLGIGDAEDAEDGGDAEPAADDEPELVPVTWHMADGSTARFMAVRFARGGGT